MDLLIFSNQFQRQSILRGTIYVQKPCEVALIYPNHIPKVAPTICKRQVQVQGQYDRKYIESSSNLPYPAFPQ